MSNNSNKYSDPLDNDYSYNPENSSKSSSENTSTGSQNLAPKKATPPNSNKPKRNNKPLFIAVAGLAVLSIAGGAIGYNYMNNASSQIAMNSSSSQSNLIQKPEDITKNESQSQLAQNSLDSSTSKQGTQLQNGDTGYEMGVAGTERIAGETRERIERYMQIANQNTEENKMDIVNLSKDQIDNLNNNQVPTIPLSKSQNKTKTLKVQYSNVGDQEFAGGEMIIKIDSGIKISKQNLKDVLEGESKDLPESVFVSDNELRIPKDKLAVGSVGYIELTLEIGDVAPGEYILRSILVEKDTGKGIPGFGYIKVE